MAGRPRGGGGSRPEGQGQPQEEPDERGYGHGNPGHGQHQGAGGPDRGAHDALLSVSGLTSPAMTMNKPFRFQSRIHLLEESRAFSLIHYKKQEWFKSLPKIARTQKHTNTKNKFRVKYGKNIFTCNVTQLK